MKKLILAFVFCLVATTVMAAAVTFRWDANTETDLAGYRLYQTDVSGQYVYGPGDGTNRVATISVDLSATPAVHPTEYRLENVADGRHYWVLTAYDLSGNESGRSNEVSTVIDSAPPAPPGGLSIWEIIIAFVKYILNWFADIGNTVELVSS